MHLQVSRGSWSPQILQPTVDGVDGRTTAQDALSQLSAIVQPMAGFGSNIKSLLTSSPSKTTTLRFRHDERQKMSEHTYQITEIVGTSSDGIDAAIRNAISRASRTVQNLGWFEVSQIRGEIADGQVAHVQVQMKVGFRLEAPQD